MSFVTDFPGGQAKLDSCRGKQPPRPEQLKLVLQWPYFGLESEIFSAINPALPDGFSFKPKGLLLYGGSGAGKTVAAWLAIRATLEEWEAPGSIPNVSCWRAAELGRAITAAAKGLDGEMEALHRALSRCGLLFADDIDKARFTPRVQSELFDLIEHREQYGLPLIVTTNTAGRELAALFQRNIGLPIANRLARICHAVDFDDEQFNFADELAEIRAEMREEIHHQVEAFKARELERPAVSQGAPPQAVITKPHHLSRFDVLRALIAK